MSDLLTSVLFSRRLLTPSEGGIAEVSIEGATPVRVAPLDEVELDGGAVVVRALAGGLDGHGGGGRIDQVSGSVSGDASGGASGGAAGGAAGDTSGGASGGALTYSRLRIQHVELRGASASYELTVPTGWTALAYVRAGMLTPCAGDGPAPRMYETVHFERHGGDGIRLANGHDGLTDCLVLCGEPLGAPVAASGTMVMNTQAEVAQALQDYQRGDFGLPWEHTLPDDQWSDHCERARQRRGL